VEGCLNRGENGDLEGKLDALVSQCRDMRPRVHQLLQRKDKPKEFDGGKFVLAIAGNWRPTGGARGGVTNANRLTPEQMERLERELPWLREDAVRWRAGPCDQCKGHYSAVMQSRCGQMNAAPRCLVRVENPEHNPRIEAIVSRFRKYRPRDGERVPLPEPGLKGETSFDAGTFIQRISYNWRPAPAVGRERPAASTRLSAQQMARLEAALPWLAEDAKRWRVGICQACRDYPDPKIGAYCGGFNMIGSCLRRNDPDFDPMRISRAAAAVAARRGPLVKRERTSGDESSDGEGYVPVAAARLRKKRRGSGEKWPM